MIFSLFVNRACKTEKDVKARMIELEKRIRGRAGITSTVGRGVARGDSPEWGEGISGDDGNGKSKKATMERGFPGLHRLVVAIEAISGRRRNCSLRPTSPLCKRFLATAILEGHRIWRR